jgi:hypothetical protein
VRTYLLSPPPQRWMRCISRPVRGRNPWAHYACSSSRCIPISAAFKGCRLKSALRRLRVVIDHSPEALEKAARKARRDFVYEETLKELQIELVHLQVSTRLGDACQHSHRVVGG